MKTKVSLRFFAAAIASAALFSTTGRAADSEAPPKSKKVNISVTVQSLIPNYDSALKSPVPRLLELIYIIDQNMMDYTGNYIYPAVLKAYGIEGVNEDLREWYVELYEHRGLEKVVVERISFSGNRSSVTYTIVMKDGETNKETSDFILDEDGEWYLNDKDL
ncbi:MAG: hypothetical protein KDN19_17585 [Verrucomicrobiae bacterium]|nr:hypothetical protein [Verrucomicrobiae bacterium]